MKHTWIGFLKAQGSPEARIMLSVGGATPRTTEMRLGTLHKHGTLDSENHNYRLELLRELRVAYNRRGAVDSRDPGDWAPVNKDGGRMRIAHLNSDGDRNYD